MHWQTSAFAILAVVWALFEAGKKARSKSAACKETPNSLYGSKEKERAVKISHYF
jgi:hypothetical protein